MLWVSEVDGWMGRQPRTGDLLERNAVTARAGPTHESHLTEVTQHTEPNQGAPVEANCEQIAWVPLRSPSLWLLETSHCKAPRICKFSSDTFWDSSSRNPQSSFSI